jgi:hypothetical protein
MMLRREPVKQLAAFAARRSVRWNTTKTETQPEEPLDKDVAYYSVTDIDTETVDTKDFFKYTWGRWLKNDENERNSRETKFSVNGLIDLLKEKLDFLQATPETGGFGIKHLALLYEGKSHKAYKIDLNDGRMYVLRVPYAIGLPEYRAARMRSEVATMDFLQKKLGLKMPTVISWSATADKRLGCEYLLLDFVAGDNLMRSWNPASHELKDKSATIKPVVSVLEKLLETKFNQYGALYFTEDVDPELQKSLPYDGETDKELVDRWRIGPTVESKFWKPGFTGTVPIINRGPFKSVAEYMTAAAKAQLTYARDFAASDRSADAQAAVETFERYAKVADTLFDGDVNENLLSPRIHVPDLSPLVVIDRGDKTYLTDIEGASIRPFALHGAPEFVRYNGEKIFKKEDVPDYDKLSDLQKRMVDHQIAQTQNQFAYEFLFSKSERKDLLAAYLPGIKRRQEVVKTALGVSVGTLQYKDLEFNLQRLTLEWPYIVSRPVPIDYPPDVIENYEKNVMDWNETVLHEHPFLWSNNWVPRDTFEELLGRGLLKKEDSGDFKLTGPIL